MALPEANTIWMDGAFVPWHEARVHVLTHGLHYGTGVLEGTRAYPTAEGVAVFRLDDHLKRLYRSARFLDLTIPYSRSELHTATLKLIVANAHCGCYVRHLAYYGYGVMGIDVSRCPVSVAISSWDWDAYLGDTRDGIRLKISSWRRNHVSSIPAAAKASGAYLNSVLARAEAVAAGYDEALLLAPDGQVAEGSAENVFVVRDGVALTPSLTAGALSGITRDTIFRLGADLGVPVRAAALHRRDLYAADEIFLSGTAAGVVPVRVVDDRTLGAPGPVTRALQRAYDAVVHGRDGRYRHWLTLVG